MVLTYLDFKSSSSFSALSVLKYSLPYTFLPKGAVCFFGINQL